MIKTIGILGTLDTKGEEFKYLKELIEKYGVHTLTINTGVIGKPLFAPDISSSEVAAAIGIDIKDLIKSKDRGQSINAMSKGAAIIVRDLYENNKIHGLISLGGSAGTTIGTTAMQNLPFGIPKIMVSTMASGNTRPYVGIKDITMIHSVVDISGTNRVLKKVLINAAAAIVGMAKAQSPIGGDAKPIIGITMFGVTTPCVTKAMNIFESEGYEVLVFHATGVGGQAMEDLVRSGFIKGVLDVTTTELADELVGGVLTAGPDRLEAAGKFGIPQVVIPGALDMVNFGTPDTVPEKFKRRKFYQHNPTVTLMRTTKEELGKLGQIIAEKLNKAKGPTALVFPEKGFSALDDLDRTFYDPEADKAFYENLRDKLESHIILKKANNHINDDQFAEMIARLLISLMKQEGEI